MNNKEKHSTSEVETPKDENVEDLPKEDLDDIEADEDSENLPKEDLNDI